MTEPRVYAARFQISGQSIAGGMGVVYPAVDLQTGEKVALKIALDGPGVPADRFLREAALLAEIAHPAIVRYLAHGTTPQGEHYLAMEWLEGETLEERLERQPPTVMETVRLAQRVLDALDVAHQHGVVHRDIKPANLFLPGRDMAKVKLLDFGIARRLFDAHQSLRLTSSGSALGTPLYMAPEQARGSNEVDGRADFFSLGCVLYECFTGKPPFAGGTTAAVLAKATLGEAGDLAHRRPDLNRRLVNLVDQMLAKDPAQRPASAAELLHGLTRITAEITNPDALPSPSDSVDSHPTLVSTGERRLVSAVLVERPAQRAAGARDGSEDASPSAHQDASVSVVDLAGVMAVALADADAGDDGFARLQLAISRLGARAERLREGQLLAALLDNARNTPTDQAIQAARCALKLKALVPDARVAIGTGRVMQAADSAAEVIDSAASALTQAHPGNIIVDEASARLLEARFELVPEANGAMRLLFEKGMRDAPRTLLGREVPCVGRDREINSLVSLYKECVSESAARVMLITAPAGGGKSRVEHEFCERLQTQAENFELLIARGDPVRASAPLGLLGMAVRASAGIAGGEPDPVQRKRLAARVARHIQGEDASRITLFLGELANIPFDDHDSPALRAARQDPRLMADQMLAAWVDWLEAECKHRPVVLMLEDLHWGDVPSVQFVDAALRTLREQPFMVLAAARPEIDQRFPKLWVDRNLQRISLAPLGGRACRKLIANALGEVAADVVERIIARADGNPFYLEEILRAVAMGGRVEDLPETVAGMVQARLDALGSDAKLILRAGSIFGQSFRAAGIKALVKEDLRDDVDRWLQIITQKEILFSRPAADTREFTFRHALLRETAYEMLAPKDRVLGHRLAAEWLESIAEREAIVVADHFEKGQVPTRAIHWLREAAQQALDSDDLGAALERVERGVRLGATADVLAGLRLIEAQVRLWRCEYEAAEQAAREAVDLSSGGLLAHAMAELIGALGRQGKFDLLEHWARELARLPFDGESMQPRVFGVARAADWLLMAGSTNVAGELRRNLTAPLDSLTPNVAARVQETNAAFAASAGDQEAVVFFWREAVRLAEAAGNSRLACLYSVNLGSALGDIAEFDEAGSILSKALDTGRKLSLTYATLAAFISRLFLLAQLGQRQDSVAMMETGQNLIGQSREPRQLLLLHLACAQIALRQAELVRAEEWARTACGLANHFPGELPLARATLSRALLARGEREEALSLARFAHDALLEHGHLEDGEAVVRLAFAEALYASGDRAGARIAIAEARDTLLARAASIHGSERQSAFLSEIQDHARTLELARLWRS